MVQPLGDELVPALCLGIDGNDSTFTRSTVRRIVFHEACEFDPVCSQGVDGRLESFIKTAPEYIRARVNTAA